MVARREREPLSPRASAGGAGAEGASSHDDDVKFWRERALRLAESGQAGPSGDAFGEGRRPGAAAAALDALLRPRASADGTRVGRSTSTSGGRASARRALDTNPTSVGPAGDGTKTRRAETHAAVASLHAVAADLTERAEAVDAELAALAERKADAHEKRARARWTTARGARPRRWNAGAITSRDWWRMSSGVSAAPRTRASTTDPRRFGFAKRRRARATRATLSRATRRSRTRHRRSPKMKRRRRRRRRRRISFRKKKTAPRA